MSLSENAKQYIWSLKYRPKTIDECILPPSIKEKIKIEVQKGNVPNMLFSGTAGVGKTTLAYAIANEFDADVLYINCSDENGIDVVRQKISSFGTSVSLRDAKKIIIMDEIDGFTDAAFKVLRATMEAISDNCSFIATCNYKHRLPEPILSRFQATDFTFSKEERIKLGSQFFKRVCAILDKENVTYDKKVVGELIIKFAPDFRKTLNELQSYGSSGSIDSGILVNVGEENFRTLIFALRDKKFNEMRKWVAENTHLDYMQVYRMIYDTANRYVQKPSLPQLILTLAKYQHMHVSVMDKELNMVACMVEIMADVEFLKDE